MLCPVVRTIKEIYKRTNSYDGGSETEDVKLTLVGGEEKMPVIYGDMDFYMTVRKLEVARFELGKPDIEKCTRYLLAHPFANKSYHDVYITILRASPSKSFLYRQFVDLYNMVKTMEMTIMENIGKYKKCVNISLPSLAINGSVDVAMLYKPNILQQIAEALVDYMNELDISCIASSVSRPGDKPSRKKFKLEAKPPTVIDMKKIVPHISGDSLTTTSAIEKIHEILSCEIEVANYIRQIEGYQAEIIDVMNDIFAQCQLIVDLISKQN